MAAIYYNGDMPHQLVVDGQSVKAVFRNGIPIWPAEGYSCQVEFASDTQYFSASGGTATLTAHLLSLHNDVVLSDVVVQPQVQIISSVEGITIQEDQIVATNRGSKPGEVRRLIVRVSYSCEKFGRQWNFSKELTFEQEANEVTYHQPEVLAFEMPDLPASGGTACAEISKVQQKATYTSGAESLFAPRYTISYTEQIKALNLGSEMKERTLLGTTSFMITAYGRTSITYSGQVYQEANRLEGYSEIKLGPLTVNDIAASGGTIGSGEMTVAQDELYTSGTTRAVSIPDDAIQYSSAVTAPSLGTTVKSRTKVGTLTATVTSHGKTANVTADVWQEANRIEEMKVIKPVIVSGTTSFVAAGGKMQMAFPLTAIFTSGTSKYLEIYPISVTGSALQTWAQVRSVSLSGRGMGIEVTAPNLGTVETPERSTAINLQLSVQYQEQSYASQYAFHVYQSENRLEGYGVPTIEPSTVVVSDLPASGGTVSSSSLRFSGAQSMEYSSGDSEVVAFTQSTSGVSVKVTSAPTAPSLGATAKVRTKVGDVSFTVSLNSKTSTAVTAAVYQAANRIESYNSPVISSFTVSDIPASGGSASKGNVMWNQTAVYTSGASGQASIADPEIKYSSAVTATSLGTTVKARTKVGTLTVTVTSHGKTSSKSCSVYQVANRLEGYSDLTLGKLSVSDIPASGGSVSQGILPVSQRELYSSGSSKSAEIAEGSVSYSTAVTAPSLGTTVKSRTKVGTLTATVTSHGKTGSATADVYQASNQVATYNTPVISSFTVSDLPASGGSASQGVVKWSQSAVYSSGATGQVSTTSGTVSYSTAVKATSLGTTEKVRTKVGTLTATVTSHGKSSSKSCDVYQSANRLEGYGVPTIEPSTVVVSDLPASGGTVSSSSLRFSGAQSMEYSSGDSEVVAFTQSSSGVSVTVTVAPTATSLGTTEKVRTKVGNVSFTVNLNGKTSTAVTAAVYQAANRIESYNSPVISSFTVSDIPASGGSASKGNVMWNQTAVYTSGASGQASIADPEIKYSSAVIAPSLGTTVKARTKVGTLTVTVTSHGKTSSKSCSVYQAANAMGYGKPVVESTTISVSDIPASGGSVSASNIRFAGAQPINYTSGSSNVLAFTQSTAGLEIRIMQGLIQQSLGKTIKARTRVGSIRFDLVLNGQTSNTLSVYVYQAANNVESLEYVGRPGSSGIIRGLSLQNYPRQGGQTEFYMKPTATFTSGDEGVVNPTASNVRSASTWATAVALDHATHGRIIRCTYAANNTGVSRQSMLTIQLYYGQLSTTTTVKISQL